MRQGRRHSRFEVVAMVTASVLIGVAACSSGPRAAPGESLEVVVKDFRISVSSQTVPPGPTTFLVHDQGPSTHEMILVKTDLPSVLLPLNLDGLTVDEESPLLETIGEVGDLDMGESGTFGPDLSPGRYVLFCNLEGHYLGGMHASLRVGPAGSDATP